MSYFLQNVSWILAGAGIILILRRTYVVSFSHYASYTLIPIFADVVTWLMFSMLYNLLVVLFQYPIFQTLTLSETIFDGKDK